MNTIKELWYSNISHIERALKPTAEYTRINTKLLQAEDAFISGLTEDQRRQFDKFQELLMRRESINEANIFTEAFRLGVQIIMDVLCEDAR